MHKNSSIALVLTLLEAIREGHIQIVDLELRATDIVEVHELKLVMLGAPQVVTFADKTQEKLETLLEVLRNDNR